MSDQFLGKFRGIVSDVSDPLGLGRLKAHVPDVYGEEESGWAMPCAPFGGDKVGFFAVPTVGAGVWVEFEHGDPEYPIWSGAWWGASTEVPPLLLVPAPFQRVLVQTEGGHSILLDDTPGTGGITLETSGGQKLVLNDLGIEIDNGKGATIKLTGPKVQVNNGALEVT